MKINVLVLIFTTFLFSFAIGSEDPERSNQYERKAAKGLEEESSTDEATSSKENVEDKDDSEPFAKVIDDLSFPNAGIKIIKVPDLSKDSESKKISDTLASMLESQEKWIQKFEEELEEMNKNELPVEVVVEKSAEEIEGN